LNYRTQERVNFIISEAFTATKFDKILSGNKPCQVWTEAQRFGDHLRLHHQGMMMMMMEVETALETLGFCPEFTRFAAREGLYQELIYLWFI
jgi:hypothetical protein